MQSPISFAKDWLFQPEYTGKNRCLPCTVTNALIAGVLGVAAWFFVSPLVAIGSLVVSAVLIGTRGYLVPGTPQLTKRYFPKWLLALFGKVSESPDTPVDPVDVEGELLDAGVLVDDGDDLRLDSTFERAWQERIDELTDEPTARNAFAEKIVADEDALTFDDEYDTAFVALVDDEMVGRWESRAAFAADLAATDVLDDWMDGWSDRSPPSRGQLTGGLRLFLETCPDCGGSLTPGEKTAESCCHSGRVVAVTCDNCDERLLEVPTE